MRNIHELIGIIKAVDFDGVINRNEIDCLRDWVDNNRNLAYEPAHKELIKLVEDVIEDNIITDDEKRTLRTAYIRIQRDGITFDDKLNELYGIIEGIISDGEINDPEVRRLKNWMTVNKKLFGDREEFKTLDKVLDDILEDNIVTVEEQEYLLKLLSESIDERKLGAKIEYLRKRVGLRKIIGMDLIDMLKEEKHIAYIHKLAERQLKEALIAHSGKARDEEIIFVSLVLIAMMYYDGNFYDNVAKVYTEVYNRYPKQKVDGKIRGIIDRFCKPEDKKAHSRAFVGNVLANAIVPNNYLKSFFEFIYDIYKTNMNYLLTNDPAKDFEFVYDGLRNKLKESGDNDSISVGDKDAVGKVYKLIKSTKDLILDKEEKVNYVIYLSVIIVNIIDKYIWGKELKIVNPYLKQGFEAWKTTVENVRPVKSDSGDFRSRWEPKFKLEGNNVLLIPPIHRVPSDFDSYEDVIVEVYNGSERIYLDKRPEVRDIVGGYEIRPKTIVLDNPLKKLVYRLKIGARKIYDSQSKLYRDFMIFSSEGKEIKNNTDYNGSIVICSNEVALKGAAYYQATFYSLCEKHVQEGSVITVGVKNFCFSAFEKAGIFGEAYLNHYILQTGNNTKIPVYKNLKYLVFECDETLAKDGVIAVVLDAKRIRLSDFKPNIVRQHGRVRYTVQLDISIAGIYSISVEHMGAKKTCLMEKTQFAIDPILKKACEQLSDICYAVEVDSAFIDRHVYRNITPDNFSLDWLRFNYMDTSYFYHIPFGFKYYRLKGSEEWHSDSQPLWINDVNTETVVEFLGEGSYPGFVLTDQGTMPSNGFFQTNGKDGFVNELKVAFLLSYKTDCDYVLVSLMKDSKPYRGIFCNNKCNLDKVATEFVFDAVDEVLSITPIYYGIGTVICKVYDQNNEEIFVKDITNGMTFEVNQLKSYTSYRIVFYESIKSGFRRTDRIMAEFHKQFYTLGSLVGRQFKLENVYYDDNRFARIEHRSKALEDTYIAIKAKIEEGKYIGNIFTRKGYIRTDLKELGPVVVEISSDIINDKLEVVITKAKKNILVDNFGVIDGIRTKGFVTESFDMKLSNSSVYGK